MFRFPKMWLILLALAAVLFLLNWQCWRLGIGSAVGGRPPGTELERFFGWPATYQAELWRSDDRALADRILASAPFYWPGDEMALEYRVLGMAALAVNVGFALLVVLSVVVILEGVVGREWGSRQVGLLAGVGLLLLALWAVSPSVSVSL